MKELKRFGVMLDLSRNAVMKPDEIKKFAKTIKSFGYNMIQLYTEETYEVENEPYFGYLRGRLSISEMKDIVSYCESIGVEMIPCIQTLAHLGCIFRWPEYQVINDTADIMMVGEERTYRLIENMFSTLRKIYTTNVIHIGMDEAHMLGLGKYLDKHGMRNRFDIIYDHLKKVIEIAKKYNFKPIMWSDMFFRLANKGQYYSTPDVITDEVVKACPEGVDLVYWDYYRDKLKNYDEMMEAHAKFGGETWFAGGTWVWKGFCPDNEWSIRSMTPAMVSCAKHGTQNIFMTMWGDNGKECSYYAALPSLFAIRQIYDGITDMNEIKKNFKNVTGENFDDFMLLDAPDNVEKDAPLLSNGNFRIENVTKSKIYADPFLGFLDYSNKEGTEEKFADLAIKLAKCAENSKYAYIFESTAALCDFMSYKYNLGVKTRKAYKENNKKELENLIPVYETAISKLGVFYKKFKNLWFTENKPHGFDVQDLRLGGLERRLVSCKERLEDYLSGKITSIPELEEELLPYSKPQNNQWSKSATVNPI